MSKLSYQRLLRAKYNNLSRNKISHSSELLDNILALPHPQREAAFVLWATKTKPEKPNLNLVYSDKNRIEERI